MDQVPERGIPLSIDVLHEQATVTVRPSGEIDMATAGRLEEALLAALREQPAILIVDLEPVTFLASMGLSVLARTDRGARAAGIEMRVVVSSQIIVRVRELTGLIDELTVFGSHADAVWARPGTARGTG